VTAEYPECDELGVCNSCWYLISLEREGASSTAKSAVGDIDKVDEGGSSLSTTSGAASSTAKSAVGDIDKVALSASSFDEGGSSLSTASGAATAQSSPVKNRLLSGSSTSSGTSTSTRDSIGTLSYRDDGEAPYRDDGKAAELFNAPFGRSSNYSLQKLRETVDHVKNFVHKELEERVRQHRIKFESKRHSSQTEKKIANLELKCLALQKTIDKEKQTISTLEPIVAENLEVIRHLNIEVFQALKSSEIPPEAYKALNVAKKNLVFCYSSQVGAYKNKDSNSSKLIEAQRELIRLGRLPCPTCSDIVVEVPEDEEFLDQVAEIERVYAEKRRSSGDDDEDDACSSTQSVNVGSSGAHAKA
jgi:hypothetical protein